MLICPVQCRSAFSGQRDTESKTCMGHVHDKMQSRQDRQRVPYIHVHMFVHKYIHIYIHIHLNSIYNCPYNHKS